MLETSALRNPPKSISSSEVVHFGAPGGTMDHVASAVGGLLRIGPTKWHYRTLPLLSPRELGVWVLAYSGEPKETIRHLKRCKTARLELFDKLGGDWNSEIATDLSETEKVLLDATRTNRDVETQAVELWGDVEAARVFDSNPDSLGLKLGALMALHHVKLRDGLGLSTPKLEAMNIAATSAGAYGFKVVGSGGGGCAVAWTSESRANKVEAALRCAGAPLTWIIREPASGAALSFATGSDGAK